jgi:hypothetical protein
MSNQRYRSIHGVEYTDVDQAAQDVKTSPSPRGEILEFSALGLTDFETL